MHRSLTTRSLKIDRFSLLVDNKAHFKSLRFSLPNSYCKHFPGYTLVICDTRSSSLMSFFIVHEVNPQLFISDVYAAKSHKTLAKHGITHILSLLSFSNIRPLPIGVENLCLDILDYPDENIIDEFKRTNQFIDDAVKAGGKVLIHCQAGISRSTTCLCAYLMKSRRISREEAFDMVKKVRKHVQPNEGFWEQLGVYEQCGYEPRKGMNPYDDWLVRFYRLGGPADPAKVQEIKLLEKSKI